MLDIAIDADGEWDSSTGWEALVRRAAEAAIAESAFPQLSEIDRAVELGVAGLTRGALGQGAAEAAIDERRLDPLGAPSGQSALVLRVGEGEALVIQLADLDQLGDHILDDVLVNPPLTQPGVELGARPLPPAQSTDRLIQGRVALPLIH